MRHDIYITGAGVSAASGIPTFRGEDGYWTVGSVNYSPQEIATRKMYLTQPDEFLLWYFQRFAKYINSEPNSVHKWLANKTLITQNIDGLDRKAGNKTFIPIHGSIDKVTLFQSQERLPTLIDAPWHEVSSAVSHKYSRTALKKVLLNAFKISSKTLKPEINISLKPFVLLFDEYYTELYKISKAEQLFNKANNFIFMGTSFSVNITNMALRAALIRGCEVTIVDPKPIDLKIPNVNYLVMTAERYIAEIDK